MTYKPNRRDKIVVIMANLVLKLATRGYRDLLHKVLVDGMYAGRPTYPIQQPHGEKGST